MHVLTRTGPPPIRVRECGHASTRRFIRTDDTIPPLPTGAAHEPILDGIAFCPGAICGDQLVRFDRPRGRRPQYLCPQCGHRVDAAAADRRVWRGLRTSGIIPAFFSTDPSARRALLQRLAQTIHITT